MSRLLLLISTCLLLSCGQETNGENQNKPETTLIENVKLAINPKYQDWVLFENGTYIVFDKADTIVDISADAIQLMKEFGPVSEGSPAGDIGITHLNRTDGWVVSGHCYGMYTYVNPNELETKTADDASIGLYGRSKREKDGIGLNIVYINRSNTIQ